MRENTLPIGPKVQICYTRGERRGFSLSDRYNVSPFSGTYSAVTHKRTKLREMLTHERCFANKTLTFSLFTVYLSLTSSPTLVCNKVEPWAWSVRCFPTAVHETLWQSIVDGPRWKGVVRLASRNSRTAAVLCDREGVR